MYQPPYRPPCNYTGTASNLTYLGYLYNYASNPSQSANVYLFNTKVHPDSGTGSNISAYERFANGDAANCITYNCLNVCEAWIGTDDTFNSPQFTLVAGQVNTVTNSYSQSFSASIPVTTSFAQCYKSGFKNVAAMLNWNGVFGWTSHDAGGCNDNFCSGSALYESFQSTPDQTKYLTATCDQHMVYNNLDANNDPITLNANLSGVRSVDPNSGIITSTISSSQTQTLNCAGTVTTIYSCVNGAGFVNEGTCAGTSSNVYFSTGGTTYLDDRYTDGHCNLFPPFAAGPPVANDNIAGFIADWNSSFPATPMPLITDANNYSCNVSGVQNPGNTFSIVASFSRTATKVQWDFTFTATNYAGTNVDSHCYGSITLSNTNTAGNVYSDLNNNLLSTWNLADDNQYPWRQSGIPQVAPLVTRNQVQGNISPLGFNPYTVNDMRLPITDASGSASFSPGWNPTYTQMAWFDSNAYLWYYPNSGSAGSSTEAASALVKMVDGSILGAPKPAGYENTFEWQFTDWHGCHFDDGMGDVGFSWWQYGYGMFLNDYNSQIGGDLPETATQWTNNYFAIGTPIGASIMYNDKTVIGQNGYDGLADTGGALIAYKYAEIKELWKSYNFARPAGADKFSYDETLVYCATDISGSGTGATLTVQDYNGNPVTIADPSGYWGGPCVGGFFQITVAGSTATLGTSSYGLPTGWVSRSGDDSVCFGKLRFPSAPSLLGRIGVMYSGSSNTASFQTAQPYFGLNAPSGSEMVDIFDHNMTAIATNITASRLSDTMFTTSASYLSASWVTIHSQSYWWNDDSPKGDFLYHTWVFDRRTNAENARLAGATDCSGSPVATASYNNGYSAYTESSSCLPLIPCCPAVICFSPNTESFTNGLTIPFPSTFIMDERYSSRWQGVPQQVMDDPLWQKPHLPCGGTDPLTDTDFTGAQISFVQDDGCCHENTTDPDTGLLTVYYAFPPQVEARNTVPTGFPALPPSLSLATDSPVPYPELSNPNLPPGFIGFNSDGTPASMLTPWILRQRLCNVQTTGNGCDSTPCQFNAEYSQEITGCNNPLP